MTENNQLIKRYLYQISVSVRFTLRWAGNCKRQRPMEYFCPKETSNLDQDVYIFLKTYEKSENI